MNSKGFIVDAPNVLVMSNDASTHIVTAKKGEIKLNGESIPISGGWSGYDLAEIDTKKKIEIDITDAEFKMDNLALQIGSEVKKGKAERYVFGEIFVVKTNKITLPYVVVANSLKINGLTESVETTPTTGKFKVTIAADNTEVTFASAEFADGVEIMPTFRVEVDNAETISGNGTSFPKSGLTVVEYPVYGEDNNDEENLIGYIQWIIYKTKIATDSGMGGSYKSASEFNMKIKGLDPRRPDKKVFDVIFRPIVAIV